MTSPAAVAAEDVSHRYGDRCALDHLSFSVEPGTVFGLLGPNGGGKTTLFRLLCTLLPLQSGRLLVLGHDVRLQPAAVRCGLGVTFQSPGLDRQLTVAENLTHHGHLYGLRGADLRHRIAAELERLGVGDRAGDRVETLSGGLQRRVEIAKALLHRPALLLLDEPSTGLDPAGRRILWEHLFQIRQDRGLTIVVSTHLLDEAERCDRLVILDRGRRVAWDTPTALRSSLGGDCLTIETDQPEALSAAVAARWGVIPQIVEGRLFLQQARGHELVRELVDAFPREIRGISLGKPTLDDVFRQRTGHRFEGGDA